MDTVCSREGALLLASARLHLDADAATSAHAAISGGIDWESFIPLADHHGVVPLLHRHFSNGALDTSLVPEAATAQLRREAQRIARRNLLLAGELVALLGELTRHGIRAVPLKGPILAQQLYGSVALRRINDLDLFVAEEDLAQVTHLMLQRGYAREPSSGSGSVDAIRDDATHHLQFFAHAKTHRVELHYNLLPPAGGERHTLAMVEAGLEPFPFLGTVAWVLRPEELLGYLCIHGTNHGWERMEWVGAVAELLRSGRVRDWERVNAWTRRLAGEGALRSGLHLATTLFDVPIPPRELDGDRSARATARSIVRRLTRDPRHRLGAIGLLAYQVRTDTGLRARCARLWSVLVRPRVTDLSAMPLPRVLWPLYLVLRPARLLARWLGRLGHASPSRPPSDRRTA